MVIQEHLRVILKIRCYITIHKINIYESVIKNLLVFVGVLKVYLI